MLNKRIEALRRAMIHDFIKKVTVDIPERYQLQVVGDKLLIRGDSWGSRHGMTIGFFAADREFSNRLVCGIPTFEIEKQKKRVEQFIMYYFEWPRSVIYAVRELEPLPSFEKELKVLEFLSGRYEEQVELYKRDLTTYKRSRHGHS